MVDKLKSYLIKVVPDSLKNIIKKKINNFKNTHPNILLFFNGSFNTEDLLREIDSQLPQNIDVLMLHTSFNNLKPMYKEGINELLDGLIGYAASRKITLVFPGFVLGKNNKSIKDYYQKKRFNIEKTPTTVGLINECFRRRKGVKRSSHPSHSLLVLGPKTDQILALPHHLCDSTFGKKTPFHNLEEHNTVIIGLGTYFYRNLTHVHVAEDLLGDKYPFPVKPSHETLLVKISLPESNCEYKLRVFKSEVSKHRDLSILRKYISKEDLHQYNFKGVPMFMAKPEKITKTLINLANKGITIYSK